MHTSENYGAHMGAARELSVPIYNTVIGVVLLIGFIINAITVHFFTDYLVTLPILPLIFGYFVVCFAGMLMSFISDNPLISFIGYLLVVIPCGAILAVGIDRIEASTIAHAALVTAILVTIMLMASYIWPNFFAGLGRVLFACLTTVIIVELVAIIFFRYYMPSIWDYLVVALFCCYIGYDWVEAQRKYRSLDNAIDSCTGLYLDIINIFLRLVSASSRSKSSK